MERDLSMLMDIREVAHGLATKGYLGSKHKRPINYWADVGRTIWALRSHGFDVPFGWVHKL